MYERHIPDGPLPDENVNREIGLDFAVQMNIQVLKFTEIVSIPKTSTQQAQKL